jgi:hypothetical protein
MPNGTPEIDWVKLSFLRDLVQAASEPESESFPLMELAESIVNSAMTRETLLRRAWSIID